jgi:hypothetical protein
MAEPTQVVNTTTSIPEYARPYVEQLLGMTGGALYNYETDADGKMIYRDAKGKIVPKGTAGAQPTPTGLQDYQPYTGERTALFSPLQMQAYGAAQGLGYNPYSTGAATGLQGLAERAGQYGYSPSTFDYTRAVAPTLQNYQMTGPADVAAQQVNAGTINAAQTGYNPNLQTFQMQGPANVTSQGVSAGDINAAQMGPAQQVSTGMFTAPGTVDAYMSPYQQAVTDIGKREAQRQADIAGTQRGARQAQAGAFGGSRSAIENAEAQRNLAQQMADIQSKGSQEAYNQAAQMFTSDQARQLAAQQANQQAGLTVGTQNLTAQQQANVQNEANRLQASGMSATQAMQAAIANQQAGLTVGQQNLASQIGTQQLGTQTGVQTALANLTNQQQANVQNEANRLQASGMNATQAMQAALANQQMGYNVGNQNLQANLGVQQLGSGQNLQAQLANQTANQQAQQLQEQSQQYGAGLGLQSLQAGMQGYQNLGNIGQNLYGQNISNLNTQAQLGGQQQQQAQNILNQQYQDFLTQQQFPYQQLSYMSNTLRGMPMSQGNQSVYQAPPSMLSQVAGAGLSLAGLSNLFGGTGKAKGGSIKEKKGKPAGLPAIVLSKMG